MSMGRLTERRALELSQDMWLHIADALNRKIGPDDLGVDDLTGLKAAYIHMFQSKETVGYCGGNLPYRTCWLCQKHWSEDDLCSECVLSIKNAETGAVCSCKSPGGLYYKCKASLESGDLANAARFAWMINVKLERALKAKGGMDND